MGGPVIVQTVSAWNWVFAPKTSERWRRPLFVGLAVALLYASVLIRLASQLYQNPNYSHGLAIPFFCAYLIWLKRDRLARVEKKPSLLGLVVVLGAIGLLYLGNIGAELFLTRISFVLVIVGLVFYFWGEPSVRLLAFPLCYLLFMIPIPAIIYNHIVFPLQLLSSQFATATLETIKIVPVLREGNLLILPHCTLEVVEACSGIRFLMSLVALALGYAYLAERSLVIRALLAVAMVPVAIVGNGFRVVVTALLAHYRGTESIDGVLHPISGVVVFLIAVVSLLALHGVIGAVRMRLRSHAIS
jgi:exosortase